MNKNYVDVSPMLNVYPDSIDKNLRGLVDFLKMEELNNVFGFLYILPSMFNTDLDRGFSVIDYELNEVLVKLSDIEDIKNMGVKLKLDFILNHASVLSKQFKDILKNGEESKYRDFFIDWNKFWDGYGEMTDEGYIMPYQKYIEKMFFRKEGLPILFVKFPDGKKVPYWNTFYQKIYYDIPSVEQLMDSLHIQYNTAVLLTETIKKNIDENLKIEEFEFGELEFVKDKTLKLLEDNTRYLGQMDMNLRSPLVWEFYEDTLQKLANYGADIIRLDAFAYATKEVGKANFLNEPEVWDILNKVSVIAKKNKLKVLPEIHSKYEEMIHKKMSEQGYMIYDFFLPGLIIDAFSKKRVGFLEKWANEILDNKYNCVNMLGCHDGIPLLDLKGILPESDIDDLIETVVGRGGHIKELHGKKNIYYQVNATYFSALGENERLLEMARAIQLFMPAKPQIWYLDLFAGKNDILAVKRAGKDGHKEINRTNLTKEEIIKKIDSNVVKSQINLIKFRNTFKAFNCNANIKIFSEGDKKIFFEWEYEKYKTILEIDVEKSEYKINAFDNGETVNDNYLI